MALGFTYKLEREDGTPADPPTFKTVATNWRPGDTIPLGRERMLRVIDVRPRTSRRLNATTYGSGTPMSRSISR